MAEVAWRHDLEVVEEYRSILNLLYHLAHELVGCRLNKVIVVVWMIERMVLVLLGQILLVLSRKVSWTA